MKNTDNMNNYHTSGYSLSNGNEYLEVRCVQFIVDSMQLYDKYVEKCMKY